jgi:hypothetical protein
MVPLSLSIQPRARVMPSILPVSEEMSIPPRTRGNLLLQPVINIWQVTSPTPLQCPYVTTDSLTNFLPSNNVRNISNQLPILQTIQTSSFNPLPIPLDSFNLITPDFGSKPTFLNRKSNRLSSSFLHVDKEPNDKAGEDTIDEPRISDPTVISP